MTHQWHTAWLANDITVFRDGTEVDRVAADDLRRVIFIYRAAGESPGDLLYALVQTDTDALLLAAQTGFAGRVNFERLDFWSRRACVFWVPERAAALPFRLRRGGGWWGLRRPAFRRVALAELDGAMDGWPLEGPQTWEQRKWMRIARKRPFAVLDEPSRLRS